MNSVRQTFNPEFINRLDEIIVFDELGDEELLDVLQLQVDQLNHTMSNHGFIVRLADDAKHWIVNKTCADRSYGARPLRRAPPRWSATFGGGGRSAPYLDLSFERMHFASVYY